MNNIKYNTNEMIDICIQEARVDRKNGRFDPLQELIRDFCNEVWHSGLQKSVEDDQARGMSCTIDNETRLMTYVLAGRVMLTFQGKDFSVTTVAAEGEIPAGMGLHGIDASINEATGIITRIGDAFKAGNLVMQADTDISMI